MASESSLRTTFMHMWTPGEAPSVMKMEFGSLTNPSLFSMPRAMASLQIWMPLLME